MTNTDSIQTFVTQPAIAVVGVSRTGRKFGNVACRELQSHGFRVYPIHPHVPMINGTRCYRSFDDLPERVNAVLVVVPPPAAVEVVRQAASAGIQHVWLQQGGESPEAIAVCRELGLDVVAGECILMFAKPAGFHRAHRWIHDLVHGARA